MHWNRAEPESRTENVHKFALFFSDSVAEFQQIWQVFLDFSLTVKAAPHECVIRTGQP